MRCSSIFAGLFMAASALALPLEASSNAALQPVEAVKDLSARAPAPQIDLTDVLTDVTGVVGQLVTTLEDVLDPVLLALQNVTAVLNDLVISPNATDSAVTLLDSLLTLQSVQTSIDGITGATVTTSDVTDLTNVGTVLQTLLDTVNSLVSTDSTNTTLTSIQTLINSLIATVNSLLAGVSS